MPLIETPTDWFNACCKAMEAPDAAGLLTASLLKRWCADADYPHPSLLTFPGADDLPYSWGQLMDLVVSSSSFSAKASKNFVTAYEAALSEMPADLENGTQWFFDQAPLRFIRFECENESTARLALNLLIDSMTAMVDVFPEPDFTTYQFFFQIYALITNAAVTERSEPDVVENEYFGGTRLTPPGTPSVFTTLDRIRDEMSGLNEAKKNLWEECATRLADTLDRLFTTLCEFNPDFADFEEGRKASSQPVPSPEALIGFQRELDAPWFRLAHAVSPTHGIKAARAIVYLKLINPPPDGKAAIVDTTLSLLPIVSPKNGDILIETAIDAPLVLDPALESFG